jgi:hypothetical protein
MNYCWYIKQNLQDYCPLIDKWAKFLYNNYMKEYISHLSAAIVWDIPYIEAVIGYKITESDLSHITVSESNARFRKNGKKTHSCELALPPGALKTRNGRCVASPELLFLELACKLSIHRLVLLALQLCSHPPGLPSEAITTKKKLNIFLAKTAGHRGHRKAIRALNYVENGSASIMESIAFMFLTLPYSMGGYGLNGAVFNYKIELEDDARIRLGQKHCFVDLYFKKEKLAVEYQSFAYHSKPSEQGKDAVRSAILELQGISTMYLNTIQLYDKNAFRDFACNLAARIGKRIRIRTKKFNEMQALMRALLPDGNLATETRKTSSMPEGRRLV